MLCENEGRDLWHLQAKKWKIISKPPEASKEAWNRFSNLVSTLILDFKPPKLGDKALLLKSPSVRDFVMAVLALAQKVTVIFFNTFLITYNILNIWKNIHNRELVYLWKYVHRPQRSTVSSLRNNVKQNLILLIPHVTYALPHLTGNINQRQKTCSLALCQTHTQNIIKGRVQRKKILMMCFFKVVTSITLQPFLWSSKTTQWLPFTNIAMNDCTIEG